MRPIVVPITKCLGSALLVAAIAAPAAGAAGVDRRSPDTRDAAAAAQAAAVQDLRSPDTRDAARAAAALRYRDLRSPDARDVGRVPVRRSPASQPGGQHGTTRIIFGGRLAAAAERRPASQPGGLHGTAWIIFGGAIASLVLAGLGAVALASRRRGTVRPSRTAVPAS
jgi:hypothetical protein